MWLLKSPAALHTIGGNMFGGIKEDGVASLVDFFFRQAQMCYNANQKPWPIHSCVGIVDNEHFQ